MANNWNLATKIYDALKDKGADLGNASIYIIEKVLNDHDSAQQSAQSDEPKGDAPKGDEWDRPGYSDFFDGGLSARR